MKTYNVKDRVELLISREYVNEIDIVYTSIDVLKEKELDLETKKELYNKLYVKMPINIYELKYYSEKSEKLRIVSTLLRLENEVLNYLLEFNNNKPCIDILILWSIYQKGEILLKTLKKFPELKECNDLTKLLLYMCKYNNFELTKMKDVCIFLLDNGADINFKDEYGNSIFKIMEKSGHDILKGYQANKEKEVLDKSFECNQESPKLKRI